MLTNYLPSTRPSETVQKLFLRKHISCLYTTTLLRSGFVILVITSFSANNCLFSVGNSIVSSVIWE